MPDRVLELVVFGLKPGVTRVEFLASVDAVSEWARSQPGFVSRDLLWCSSDGRWVEVVWWRSLADARNAAERIEASSACGQFMSLIDEESILIVHALPAIEHVAA